MRLARWTLGGGALLLAIVLGTAGADDSEVLVPLATQAVRVGPVRATPPTRDVTLFGVTRAVARGQLAFTSPGRLKERPAAVGDTVRRGDVLARLDPAPFENQVRAATAQVADLEARATQLGRDRARIETLSARQSVSTAEVEQIRSQELSLASSLDAARAQLAEADRQRRESVIIAPWDGTVAVVLAEPGETVAAGQPVVLLSGTNGLEVEVSVPERVWARLSPEATASVHLPVFDRTVPAEITSIGRAATPGGLFPVVVALPAEGLVPGLTAAVHLAVPTGEGLTVPVAAVVDPTGAQAAVYRVDHGVVERVLVEPTELYGDAVAVLGPLSADDQVVVSGHGRLLSGDAVRVLP